MIIVQNIDLRSWKYFKQTKYDRLLKSTRVEAIFIISVDFAEKNRKNDETSSMDFKIESPNYGNQR